MSPVHRLLASAVLAALLLVLPATARAQGGAYEIQVYGAETVEAGHTMVELHTNTAVQGFTRTVDRVLPTEGAWHETIEITHGWTPWFETGFYIFTSIQPDGGWEWVGDHIRPRVRIPESWKWPVGLSLSTEIGYQRREFSTDTWTLELRPIIDKQIGPWYVAFNPAIDWSLEGQNASRGAEFAPNVKVSYDVTKVVTLGLEYYGVLGPISGFDPFRQQEHQIFPVIDLNLGPQWEFNLGVGFGLTPATDSVVVKMIIGYRF